MSVDLLAAYISKFGHVLKREKGHDKSVPSAIDNVVHMNIQLQGRPAQNPVPCGVCLF